MANEQQLIEGIRRADAAGDTAGVQALGSELLRIRQQPKAKPAPKKKPTSFFQGFGEEIAKAGNNALYAMSRLNPVTGTLQGLSDLTGIGKQYTPRATYQNARQAQANAMARSPYQGSTAGKIVGSIVGSIPMAFLPGGVVAQGAAAGGLMSNNLDDVRGTARDAAIGAAAGKVGEVVGGAALRAGSKAFRAAKPAVSNAMAVVTGKTMQNAQAVAPTKSGAILLKTLTDQGMTPQQAAVAIKEAQDNGVPLALMDTGDEMRALAASLARKPGASRQLIKEVVKPRQLGQTERVQAAISRDLGPVANVREASEKLMEGAKVKAGPLYEKAYQAPNAVEFQGEVVDLLNRPSMQKALANAVRIAKEEGREPKTLGFIVDDTGSVSFVPQDGRFINATIGKPREVLGSPPEDLVTFLRKRGGLKDQNSELSHMGLNNKGRSGDFVGLETKFGPLVSEQGRNFDDAALAAWEAGYFPELSSRPSVNQFLDAVRGTHEGWGRRFLPEDEGRIVEYMQALDNKSNIQQTRFETGKPPVIDTSVDAGPREFPPVSAYGEQEVFAPTWQTYDYIKRGMDDVVEGYRDKVTGKLNLDTEGRAVNNTLRDFIGRIDKANPVYAEARATFAGPAKMASALRKGEKIVNKDAETIMAEMKNLSPTEIEQYRLGARSALSKMIEGRTDAADKVKAIVGTEKRRKALAQLFGGNRNLDRLIKTLEQEGATSETYGRAYTGSMSALNLADDAGLEGKAGVAANSLGRAIMGQGMARNAMATAADLYKYGAGKAGERVRSELAAGLSETDPKAFAAAVKAARRGAALDRAGKRAIKPAARKVGQAAALAANARDK